VGVVLWGVVGEVCNVRVEWCCGGVVVVVCNVRVGWCCGGGVVAVCNVRVGCTCVSPTSVRVVASYGQAPEW